MAFPEPIGLVADVMAATARLLEQLCARLKAQEAGARVVKPNGEALTAAKRPVLMVGGGGQAAADERPDADVEAGQ